MLRKQHLSAMLKVLDGKSSRSCSMLQLLFKFVFSLLCGTFIISFNLLAMFCSIACIESSSQIHCYECEIIEDLLQSGITHIVLRMLFEGLALFDRSVNGLEELLNESSDYTIFNFDKTGNKLIDNFRATICLARSDEAGDIKPALRLLNRIESFQETWKNSESFLKTLLRRLTGIANHNVHGIGAWSLCVNGLGQLEKQVNPLQLQQLIGNGCNLVSSLLNHSCAPNIRRLNVNDKVVIIVSRPIPKTGQLFDSYRLNFNQQSRDQRRQGLMNDYGFECDCEACEFDYPLNQNLPIINEQLAEYVWEALENIPLLSTKEAQQKLREFSNLFTKHSKSFPSAELIVLQECMANLMMMITKPPTQLS